MNIPIITTDINMWFITALPTIGIIFILFIGICLYFSSVVYKDEKEKEKKKGKWGTK